MADSSSRVTQAMAIVVSAVAVSMAVVPSLVDGQRYTVHSGPLSTYCDPPHTHLLRRPRDRPRARRGDAVRAQAGGWAEHRQLLVDPARAALQRTGAPREGRAAHRGARDDRAPSQDLPAHPGRRRGTRRL